MTERSQTQPEQAFREDVVANLHGGELLTPMARVQEPLPIAAQHQRRMASPRRVVDATTTPAGVDMVVGLADGTHARLRAEATRSGALHLQWNCPATAPSPVSLDDGMLGDGGLAGTARASVERESAEVATPRWRFAVEFPGLAWSLSAPHLDVRERPTDLAFGGLVRSYGLGTSSGAGLRTWSHDSLALDEDERLYGAGAQYLGLQRRGQRLVLYNQDTLGSNASPLSYANVPFLWSTRGYGVVVHAGGRVLMEMGYPVHDTLTVGAEGGTLDLYLLLGGGPREILHEFYALAGPVPSVEPWTLGIWMSRCAYESADQVMEIVKRLDNDEFPFDVLHLDPLWMRCHRDGWSEGVDWEWDVDRWGPPEEFFAWMRERRVRVSLWECPYALAGSQTHTALEELGGLARGGNGPARAQGGGVGSVIDFTNPAARQWVTDQHRRMMAAGAAVFKSDFGEGVPDDAVFSDGRTGRDIHNLYALLYNRTVAEAESAAGARDPLVFGRSGWLGSHRYPIQWSADAKSTWEELRGSLRGGLSHALSGFGYWSSDIGGFHTDTIPGVPQPELFARWAWLGCLLPIARFHGMGSREPWAAGSEAYAATLTAARLRYRLLPYLHDQLQRSDPQRMPLIRPLVFDWPDDPRLCDDATQYLLGDSLLVAPVLKPGGRRTVRVPDGEWADWWTGEPVTGPTDLHVTVPLDRAPIYQRAGTAIPLGEGRRAEDALDVSTTKPAHTGYADI